ncbi:MAG TPA: sigma-70 family RNA polymerase sigma factor [Puia sp.]|jgi:RNA polymerase sigma-70 factor (ECF subfamily)|nr:sigma-70 family RNA polymerase sigma factor [Puia sp.]
MRDNHPSDSALLEGLRADSRDAFAAVYRRYCDSVYLCTRKLSGDDDLASDLTQEVFKGLWDYRSQLRDARHLRSYIFFMARCHFLEHLRKVRTVVAAQEELALLSDPSEPSIELAIITEEVFAELEAALRQLSPQRKQVMQLRYFEGLDIRSIALRLDIAPQTVRNHISQAIEFLRLKKILLPTS